VSGTIFSATVFLISNGEVRACTHHSCDPDFKPVVLENILNFWGADEYGIIEADSDSTIHYIGTSGGSPARLDRPPVPYVIDKTTLVAGSGDFVTITGLHIPCTIVVDDPDPLVETATHTVEDGGFEFEPETPGVYVIEISHFPFLPARIEITAT
jgi:hypothetical protein